MELNNYKNLNANLKIVKEENIHEKLIEKIKTLEAINAVFEQITKKQNTKNAVYKIQIPNDFNFIESKKKVEILENV